MNSKEHAFVITDAFKRIVGKVSLLPAPERASWGILTTENVEDLARAFEYHAKLCHVGDELPTYEGFRRLIIGRADSLAKLFEEQQKQREKYRFIDALDEDEKEAACGSPADTSRHLTRRKTPSKRRQKG